MSIRVLFWDVDTQHDFVDAPGALPAPGASAIRPNLERLTQFAVDHDIPIVASGDAHPPDDPEFQEFGPHCVQGTPGQEKIPETRAPQMEVADADRLQEQLRRLQRGHLPQILIHKEELDVFTEPVADSILRRLDPDHVYVYGVTTEYCVKMAAEGIMDRGYSVTVVRDAVRAIDSQQGERALEEMAENGAELIDTEAVVRRLRESQRR